MNVITLPISVNGKIVASVTLMKNGEEIIQSISARGEGFDRLNKVLNDNKETEFAFFFVDGMTEIVISPTNDIYFIKGKDTIKLDNKVDYYGKYKTDKNVFSYKLLINDDNCLKVIPLPDEEFVTTNTSAEESLDNNIHTDVVPTTQEATINLTVDDILSKTFRQLNGQTAMRCFLVFHIIVVPKKKQKILFHIYQTLNLQKIQTMKKNMEVRFM